MSSIHVVITRFSFHFNPNKPDPKLLSSERLTRRFELFEAFCYPSVISQTNQDFIWMILIDPTLPELFLKRLQELTRAHPNIYIVPWTHEYHLRDPRWIQKVLPLDAPYLITTRLDDDDALSEHFVETVRSDFRRTKIQDLMLLTYPCGYVWKSSDGAKSGRLYPLRQPLIAIGLTLIVKLELCPLTVFFGNHTHLIKILQDPVSLRAMGVSSNGDLRYQIRDTRPMYIRSVHDTNDQKHIRVRTQIVSRSDVAFHLNYQILCRLNLELRSIPQK